MPYATSGPNRAVRTTCPAPRTNRGLAGRKRADLNLGGIVKPSMEAGRPKEQVHDGQAVDRPDFVYRPVMSDGSVRAHRVVKGHHRHRIHQSKNTAESSRFTEGCGILAQHGYALGGCRAAAGSAQRNVIHFPALARVSEEANWRPRLLWSSRRRDWCRSCGRLRSPWRDWWA